VVTGSLATLVAVVVALLVGKIVGFLDVDAIAKAPGHYLITHPEDLVFALVVVFLVSYGLAWLVATYAPGKGPRVFPDSGWYAAFERMRPEGHVIVATAEMRDGRKLTGLVQSFTAEQTPTDDRELTLKRSTISSMQVLMPDGRQEDLNEDFIILRGSEIVYVAASFVPASPSVP
jgi:hypothetical protein